MTERKKIEPKAPEAAESKDQEKNAARVEKKNSLRRKVTGRVSARRKATG
ncbi:MAG TPA: hypothetical protein VLA82_09530 [Actinomycetota bacterium]|nr:hypothetical protein [Actinomycetota bacterium]